MGVEIKTVKTITCKHCGSEAVMRYDAYKGVPRYLYKVCRRKFKADDNLSGMRLPVKYYPPLTFTMTGRVFVLSAGTLIRKEDTLRQRQPPMNGYRNTASI
jgi:hypothetical protein